MEVVGLVVVLEGVTTVRVTVRGDDELVDEEVGFVVAAGLGAELVEADEVVVEAGLVVVGVVVAAGLVTLVVVVAEDSVLEEVTVVLVVGFGVMVEDPAGLTSTFVGLEVISASLRLPVTTWPFPDALELVLEPPLDPPLLKELPAPVAPIAS